MRFLHLALHETSNCTEHRFVWYSSFLHINVVVSWFKYSKKREVSK